MIILTINRQNLLHLNVSSALLEKKFRILGSVSNNPYGHKSLPGVTNEHIVRNNPEHKHVWPPNKQENIKRESVMTRKLWNKNYNIFCKLSQEITNIS